MGKLVRNTIFTLIALVLAAIGLSWNRQVSQKNDPVQISQTVLSAVKESGDQPFPLTVTFAKSHLKLGQYQELQVITQPNAELEIVTIYPNGSVNNPQTLAAVSDETGRYTLKFKLDDFTYLGVFETKVIATSGAERSEASSRFALQTWIVSDIPLAPGSTGYLYPLVP